MTTPEEALPELTREDAIEAMQGMAYDLYRAQDRIALVREMLDAHTGPLDAATVRAWLDQPVCPRAESEQQTIARLEATLVEARGQTLREAAAALRAWGEDGHLRKAEDEYGIRLHQSPFYMWEDADRAADLVEALIPDAAGQSRAAADSGEQP